MRIIFKWWIVAVLVAVQVQMLAQPTNPPIPAATNLPVLQTNAVPDIGTPPGSSTSTDLWALGIGIVTPIIVAGVRWVLPSIPTVLLPAITPLIGILLGLILNILAGAQLSWFDAAKGGALAVFFREVVNQAITKRLQEKPAVPPPT